MSTPVTTPIITQQPDARPARPRFTSRKSVRSVATGILTLAISIGAGVMLRSHDTEKAMKDFAADVRDEPGIKSVREVPAPEGYAGMLEINGGGAVVRFKEEGNNLLMASEITSLDNIVQVDAAIAHAADEAGFDDES